MDCRTALAPGDTCDAHPKAKTLDLNDANQRRRAVDLVWGPPHLRGRQIAKAGSVGGGAGGLFEGCQACDIGGDIGGEAAVAILVIIVAAIAAVLLYYLVKWIVHAIRNYRARPRPAGSAWRPHRPTRTLRGKITEASQVRAPLTDQACAAWGVTITHDRTTGGPVMLRDGRTAGMTLLFDDGRTVRIPEGRVRFGVLGSEEKPRTDYLQRIDPEYSENEEQPVIPVDEAHEVRLEIGDTVEIIGGLEEKFDANAPAGYRDAPPTQLAVSGTPTLVPV